MNDDILDGIMNGEDDAEGSFSPSDAVDDFGGLSFGDEAEAVYAPGLVHSSSGDYDERGDEEDDGEDDEGDDEDNDRDAAINVKQSEDIVTVPEVDETEFQEIGGEAVWLVSSAKPGFGVQCLRSNDPDTFWQSDAIQPHSVEIQFNRMVSLSHVAILLDIDSDESYTPLRITLSGGTNWQDMNVYRRDELAMPSGWVLVPLTAAMTCSMPIFNECVAEQPPRVSLFRLQVLQNYENGRDTRIRGLRVYAPREPSFTSSLLVPRFDSVKMNQFSIMR